MKYTYKTKGTCSSAIEFDLNNNIVTNVHFYGGCDGNLKALSRLVEGATTEEIETKLAGITCGWKKTSCADQLAQAVREARNSQ
jgi:uncharacterized protein (TIGR03905 family)